MKLNWMISKAPHNFTWTILVNGVISRGKRNSILRKESASFSQLTLGRAPSLEPTGPGDTHAWEPRISVINTRVLFSGMGFGFGQVTQSLVPSKSAWVTFHEVGKAQLENESSPQSLPSFWDPCIHGRYTLHASEPSHASPGEPCDSPMTLLPEC